MTWLSWDDVNDLKPMFPYGGNALVAVINGAAGAQKSGLPSAVSRIVGNAPNPFNPMTKVQFELAAPGQVRLAVFDVTGRLVKVLHQGPLAAGPHTRVWQGEDSAGRRAASGVYYLRMETDGEAHHRKMMLLK